MTDETLPGLEDQTPPAGEYIKELLRYALEADDRTDGLLPSLEAIRACKTNAEIEKLYDRYYVWTWAFLMHSTLAHVLIRLEENHPNLAAGLAAEVQEYLDAGDAYPEWIWEWAQQRGLDPEAIRADVRKRYEEWLHTVPKHLQTSTELDIPSD